MPPKRARVRAPRRLMPLSGAGCSAAASGCDALIAIGAAVWVAFI